MISSASTIRTLVPRLAFFCPGKGTGGPWRYVHAVLAGLDADEFEVTVFSDLVGIYEPRPTVILASIMPLPLEASVASVASSDPAPLPRKSKAILPKAARLMAGFGKETRRLAKIFRQHRIDVLHTQNTGCEESPVAAKLAGIRNVIGTFHVDSTYDLHRVRSGPSHRMLEIASNRCLDTGIAVSHATRRDWIKRTHVPAARVTTIHNGIDPEKFHRRSSREVARRELGLREDALIVGGLGRLDEAKGFEHLLEAAATLRNSLPSLVVAIAGDGALRGSLERKSDELGLQNVVRFLGFQTDVQKVLDALDVFAMPSLCEALPFALLEAMATELPAVGSSVGGIPEVIVEGETGFIVAPRRPDRLVGPLLHLLRDADLRRRIGVAARERVITHFHERDMVRKTIEIYRRCTQGRRAVEAGT